MFRINILETNEIKNISTCKHLAIHQITFPLVYYNKVSSTWMLIKNINDNKWYQDNKLKCNTDESFCAIENLYADVNDKYTISQRLDALEGK